jgi:MFS family permease
MSAINIASASYPPIDAPSGEAFAVPSSEAAVGGISWGAVWAGAIASAALSVILLFLGVGLGLSSISPWFERSAGSVATTVAVSAIAWVTLTQILASGLGGYMAGRLRGHWHRVHDHEVYFRDTAHGLVAWSVATLVMGVLMASGIGNVLGQASRTDAQQGLSLAAQAQVGEGRDNAAVAYWTDTLLRADTATQGARAPVDAATDNAQHAQVNRVLVHALLVNSLSESDSRFLTQLVSARTGLTAGAAQAKVAEVFGQASQAMQANLAALEKARKASAYAALWMFVALLAGAFVAAWMATYGGRQRDAAILTM